MNQVVKPEVAERAAPAIPETPAQDTPPPAARSRSRRLLGRLALLVVLVVAAFFAWEKFENRAPSKDGSVNSERPVTLPQTVRVGPVTAGDMPITIDALGTVTPFETVTIRTQIAGKLMELGFTEGQMVKKGDFLAQIDPRPYQAALAQAQGQLAKDQALLVQAQSDLSRYRNAKQAGFDLQAAGRRPGGAGRPGQGRDHDRPGAGADRRSSIWTTPTSSRRSPAARG